MAAFEEGQDIAIRGFLTARQRIRRVSTVALALATDTNNAAPTGLSTASTLLVTCSVAGTKITGLAAGALGDEITIRAEYNSLAFVLTARDSASTSTNWFSMVHDITLQPYQSISFRYQLVASGNPAWVPIDDRFGTAAAKNVGDFLGSAPTFMIPLSADTQSTMFGSATKLTVGRKYFDPTASKWNLTPTSTATFYALLEVTNSSNSAACELYRETGSGSPVVVGTPSTTNGVTATLVSVSVSSAFLSTAIAGNFAARVWITTANGTDEVTCSGAWIEVTP